MAIEFHKIKIKEIIRETHDSVSLVLDISDDLKEEFKYKSGQYLTLKIRMGGKDFRRAYSISSSPYVDREFIISVKQTYDGFISKYINEHLKPGDEVDVLRPLGNFYIIPEPENKHDYVFFGGGSGITPLISMIKTILNVESQSRVLLVFANKTLDSVIYKDEIKRLTEDFTNFRVVNILSNPPDNWKEYSGRLDYEKISEIMNENSIKISNSDYYMCGPPGMMKAIIDTLYSLGAEKNQIHKESFRAPKAGELDETVIPDTKPKIVTREVTVMLYGEKSVFKVLPGDTILTAAMGEGLMPPFSCQIGACSTCRAKLVSGEVLMDEREALTDEEIEEGYVLTCQSHPVTDNVVVNYDEV